MTKLDIALVFLAVGAVGYALYRAKNLGDDLIGTDAELDAWRIRTFGDDDSFEMGGTMGGVAVHPPMVYERMTQEEWNYLRQSEGSASP